MGNATSGAACGSVAAESRSKGRAVLTLSRYLVTGVNIRFWRNSILASNCAETSDAARSFWRPGSGAANRDGFSYPGDLVTSRKSSAARTRNQGKPDAAGAQDSERNRKRPTINDIARLANVSKKTVSRVINDSPFVREETRERISAIINELGFAPDPQARGLAFRRSFLIGMIYDNPTPQYVVNMQQGILDAMRGTSFELVIRPCNRQDPNFLQDMRAFVERQKLFGVVLTPSVSEDERLIDVLDEIECPYVRIASISLDEPESMVVTHDHIGGMEAARHLAKLGHTRIAHISGPSLFRSAHERRRGFAQGLAEAGVLDCQRNLIARPPTRSRRAQRMRPRCWR